jgi:hypothetical protein
MIVVTIGDIVVVITGTFVIVVIIIINFARVRGGGGRVL